MSRLEPTNEASAMQKEISAIAEQGGGTTKVEQLIQQYCPDGVEYMAVGCISEIKRGERLTKSALKTDGEYIVVSGGVSPMGRYTNYNRNENTITISSYGAAGYVGFQTEKFWANDVCLCVFPKDVIGNKYLYYALKREQNYLYSKTTKAIPDHIPTEIILDLKIPVPPLPVQEEIVRILDTFTELQAELQAELQKRLQQYNYYRDKLLSFSDLSNWGGQEVSVEWKKLGEITTILRGKRLTKSQLSNDKPYAVYHGGLEPLGYYESANRTANTTMIINVGASAGTIGYSKEDFWSSDGCYCVEHSKLFDDRYIYYALQTKEQQLKSKVRVAGIPTLDKPVVEDLLVPIPPLTEQQRIVDILDRFDKLTNDITAGLPAEIEARRKQYEHYRDQLLTFKQKA